MRKRSKPEKSVKTDTDVWETDNPVHKPLSSWHTSRNRC